MPTTYHNLHLIAIPHDQVEAFTAAIPVGGICMSMNANAEVTVFAIDTATAVAMRIEE